MELATDRPIPASARPSAAAGFQPRFQTLVEIYEHAVTSFADRPLFGVKREGVWRWMNYRDFEAKTDALRAGLAGLGIGSGDRVAIISNNRPEWAVAAYATYGCGAAFVPMYESQVPDEWEYILADCGAKAVVCAHAKIRDALLEMKPRLPSLEHILVLEGGPKEGTTTWSALEEAGRAKKVPVMHPAPSDLAGLIYTSGTTGKPKGVRLSHANLAYNVSAIHEVFPMSTEDRSLSFLPWAHSFGQTVELHGLFSMGASMGIAESVDKIVDNLREVKPTLLISVPRIFNRLYDRIQKQLADAPTYRQRIFQGALANSALRKKLGEERRTSGFAEFKHRVFDRVVFQKVRESLGGQLRYAFSGGAAISREVAEFIDHVGITVYEGYGLTETSPIATANWPGARKIGTGGKAIPGVRITIDPGTAADGRDGEIIVHGHNVMQGYHHLPEEDAKVFTAEGGFRTGDMGHLDDEGFLTITGRIKEQYKLETGKYVAPSHLEDQLKLSPFIVNAFLYGENKPYNVALIVPDLEEVSRWAKAQGITAKGDALLQHPKVEALLRDEVDKHSAEFKQFEKIKKLKLIGEDFTQENGMLTPKLSLKRRVVRERWNDVLQGLYR